jgi:hypothetical protein
LGRAYIKSGRVKLLGIGENFRVMVDGNNIQVNRPTFLDFISCNIQKITYNHYHISADHIGIGCLICGVIPSISKSWAAFLENQGSIVALRRVS